MEARSDAIRKLTQSELPNLLEENRRVHQLLTEGVDVEYYANDGVLTAGKVLLLDFDRPRTMIGWPCSSWWLSAASTSAGRTWRSSSTACLWR